MQGFLPRFRRKIDRNKWVPIGEGSARAMATNDMAIASARLDGPPDLYDPIQYQTSPSYDASPERRLSRSDISNSPGGRGPWGVAAGSVPDTLPRMVVAPVVSSTVTSLDDIRHAEQCVPTADRLSHVPTHPVLLEGPHTPRRQRSRRRLSIGSTNTAGLMMAVGALPGSEPYDEYPVPALPGVEHDTDSGLTSPLSPLVSPFPAFHASVAKIMTVHRVLRSSTVSSPPSHQASWPPDSSSRQADRGNLSVQSYYSPNSEQEPFIKPSQTWPPQSVEQRAARLRADPRIRFSRPREGARDVNCPPTPPPKDPGYIARRPTGNPGGHHRGGLRKTHSSPNLVLFPRTERNNHGRTRSQAHQTQAWGSTEPAKVPSPRRYSASRKPSQILDLCAKFIHRSIPRISVSA